MTARRVREPVWAPIAAYGAVALAVVATTAGLTPRAGVPVEFLIGLAAIVGGVAAVRRRGWGGAGVAVAIAENRPVRPRWAIAGAVCLLASLGAAIALDRLAGALWLAIAGWLAVAIGGWLSRLGRTGWRPARGAVAGVVIGLGAAALVAITPLGAPPDLGAVALPRQYGNLEVSLEATRTYRATGVLFALGPGDDGRFRRVEEVAWGDDYGYLVGQAIAARLGFAPSWETNLRINHAVYLAAVFILAAAAGARIGGSVVPWLPIGAALIVAREDLAVYLYGLIDQRGATVSLGLIGLAALFGLPAIVRRASITRLTACALGLGLLAGGFGLIRQNAGLAFQLAGLLTLIGLTARRGISWTAPPVLAWLIGTGLIGLSFAALLADRDVRLNLAAAPPAETSHGAWFSLLGGTGRICETSLGVEWRDEVMARAVANQILIGDRPRDLELGARSVYLGYLRDYPREFAVCLAYKTYAFGLVLVDEARWLWGRGLATLVAGTVVTAGLSRWWHRRRRKVGPETGWDGAPRPLGEMKPSLLAGLLYAALTAAVPILTNPIDFARETVAILFGLTLIWLQAVISGLIWSLPPAGGRS